LQDKLPYLMIQQEPLSYDFESNFFLTMFCKTVYPIKFIIKIPTSDGSGKEKLIYTSEAAGFG